MSHSLFRIFPLTFLILGANLAAAMAPPEVLYQTEIPGYYIPHAREIVTGTDGSAYFIGSAYEDQHSLDVIVSRLNPDGSLAWTQYITGAGHCYATGLALDSGGRVWVAGWTDAEDFPMVGAMDGTLTGFRDIFLMQLDQGTGNILYSTFIGGDYTDAAEDIFIDTADNIYLTGYTGSTDFPVTEDAYQSEPGFPEYFYQDAFITKLAPGGQSIAYSTYFGGIHDDTAYEIEVDLQGNMVLAGTTDGFGFPLVDPLQEQVNDIFVTKLSADGQTVLFSTYYGGEDLDRLSKLQLDPQGNALLAGITRSVYFPTTSGAFQEFFAGAINGCEVPFGSDYNCEDMYVSLLATDGSGLIWSTYLGGSHPDEARDVALAPDGAVYVAGYTTSANFPGYEGTFGAAYMLCRLGADGQTLDYNHFQESGSANRGNGVAVDAEGDIYLTGTVGVPASLTVTKLGNRLISSAEEMSSPWAALRGNHPNPFNPSTSIAFFLAGEEEISLKIYDLAGRQVADLASGTWSSGDHLVRWDARGNPGGVYLCRLVAGDTVLTRKMTVVK